MVGHPGDDLGMRSLDEQRANAAEEGSHVTDHPPRDGVGTEQAGVARVRQRLGEGVLGVLEHAGGRLDDPIAISVDDPHGPSVSQSPIPTRGHNPARSSAGTAARAMRFEK